MSAQIASMLDELMGRNRNAGPNEKVREIKWYDSEICKYHLVSSFCPYTLFTNTKADMGTCPFEIHDENIRQKFQEEFDRIGRDGSRFERDKRDQYVKEYLKLACELVDDMENKIVKSQERLKLTQSQESLPSALASDNIEVSGRMKEISDEITRLVGEAEKDGNNGEVDEAQNKMILVEQLKMEKDSLAKSVLPPALKDQDFMYSSSQYQKPMEVCKVCGAFLIIGDVQQRVDDHLLGKLHVGYAKLRESVKSIRAREDTELEERRKVRRERIEKEEKEKKEQHRDSSVKKSSSSRSGGKSSRSRSPRDSSSRHHKSSSSRHESHKSHRHNRSRSRSRDRGDRHNRPRGSSKDRHSHKSHSSSKSSRR